MNEAASTYKDISELQLRAKDANKYWMKKLYLNGKKVAAGCEPPKGDVYPYYK